jgi:hypothetical protein
MDAAVPLPPREIEEKEGESSPSSPMNEQQSQPSHHHEEGEEEASLSQDNQEPGASETAGRESAVSWVSDLPWKRQPSAKQNERLAMLVAQAWSAGWTPEALRQELTAELGGVRSLYAVWESRLRELPAPPLAPVIPLARSAAPSCAQHPGAQTRNGECSGCWAERYA